MTPFANIKDAATITGLSMYYLRAGCRDGTIPHVKCGNKFMVNIPALLRLLDAEGGDQDARK